MKRSSKVPDEGGFPEGRSCGVTRGLVESLWFGAPKHVGTVVLPDCGIRYGVRAGRDGDWRGVRWPGLRNERPRIKLHQELLAWSRDGALALDKSWPQFTRPGPISLSLSLSLGGQCRR